MSEIKIDDKYSIVAESSNCYVLSKSITCKRKKTGEEYTSRQVLGYFYTIYDACRGYVREIERDAVLSDTVGSVNDLIDTLSMKEFSLRETAFKRATGAFEQKGDSE